jgi:hypothetical protein
VRLGFSSRGSKDWTLSSHWDTTWAKICLQYDNGQNAENRMLVFYSPESLERLVNAQTFFICMDGTFSVPPWDTTWAKIWLGLSLVLVARSFMAFLVFEYLMLVSLGA